MHSTQVITVVDLKNTKYPCELIFFPSREEIATCRLRLPQTHVPPPVKLSQVHPSQPWTTSLGSGITVPASDQQERFRCWPRAAEVSWQREAGTGKIPAEFQPLALWQGKPICFQVYFILHCTLLIKWTFNPFEKPHGAQIHLANLSFPPGVYLD